MRLNMGGTAVVASEYPHSCVSKIFTVCKTEYSHEQADFVLTFSLLMCVCIDHEDTDRGSSVSWCDSAASGFAV